MSLLTDIIFVKALRSNSELMAQLPAGDVHNTAIALPDEDLDNAELPFIIVSFDGLQVINDTKDDSFEGEEDRVQIGVLVAAKTRRELSAMLVVIRQTIRQYFRENYGDTSDTDHALIPNSISLTAQSANYDPMKTCFWQTLSYQCDTDID